MTQVGGPHDSLPFGQVGADKAAERDIQQAGQQPPGAPPAEPQQQGAPPVARSEGVVPIPVQPQPVDQRLNTGMILPPPRVGPAAQQSMAYRDRLRQWAQHPQAGTGLRTLADSVAEQRGPLDKKR